MLRSKNNLDRCVVSGLPRAQRGGHGDLRQTDLLARVCVVGGSSYLERRDHGQTHIYGIGAFAEVHVDETEEMASEPAGLKGDGTASGGPVGAVRCERGSATWICPLLAEGVEDLGGVARDGCDTVHAHSHIDIARGVQAVASPARVCKDKMRRSEREGEGEERECGCGEGDHGGGGR